MKKVNVVIFFLLCCQWTIGQKSQTLQDTISSFFKEVRFAAKKATRLWDKNIYGPVLLVNPYTRIAFSNFPDSAGVLKKEDNIYKGILPPNVIIGNASIHWNGITWAMILVVPPTYLHTDKYDRINLLSHELFHVAQSSLSFPIQNELSNNHLDQKKGRIYFRLELEALKKAIQATDANEINIHLSNAMLFRRYRYYLFPGADKSENILELNEGITEYTGAIIADRNEIGAKIHFIKKIDDFLVNPTYVRTFPYYTIPVYGYLLRRTDKYWNKEIDSKTNLTDYFTQKFNFKIQSEFKDKNKIDAVAHNYGFQHILKEEEQREEEAKRIMQEYKKRFLEQPVFEIQFYSKRVSFDSRYVRPLEDKGIVYPTLTATDIWGKLEVKSGGGLMNAERNTVIISTPFTIEGSNISGDGWDLKLNEGYSVVKDENTNNYKLIKN